MAKLLSDKFREAIDNADFADDKLTGLYQAVNGMSDDDFKEYMYSNRAYFKQNMPVAVDEIEGFQQYVSEEPKWGVNDKVDYEKLTGSPDALSDEKFYNYDMKDMEYFGSKVGMTGRQFLKQMAEDKIKQDRYAIAHGESDNSSNLDKIASYALALFGPRQQEAIERGEDPSFQDYTLDMTEDLAYATPWSKIGVVTKLPKVGGLTKKMLTVGENAITPTITRVADKLAYDEDKPRGGEFSKGDLLDIGKGYAVNEITPRLLNRVPITKPIMSHIPLPAQTFATNRIGDAVYENRQAPGGIGMLLNMFGKDIDAEEKEKQRQKNKEAAEKKYKGKLTRKLLEGEE